MLMGCGWFVVLCLGRMMMLCVVISLCMVGVRVGVVMMIMGSWVVMVWCSVCVSMVLLLDVLFSCCFSLWFEL